jgi:hypothetical protein
LTDTVPAAAASWEFFIDSEKDPGKAVPRCVAFAEFWPDVKKIVFKKKPASPQPAAGERQCGGHIGEEPRASFSSPG